MWVRTIEIGVCWSRRKREVYVGLDDQYRFMRDCDQTTEKGVRGTRWTRKVPMGPDDRESFMRDQTTKRGLYDLDERDEFKTHRKLYVGLVDQEKSICIRWPRVVFVGLYDRERCMCNHMAERCLYDNHVWSARQKGDKYMHDEVIERTVRGARWPREVNCVCWSERSS